MNESLRAILAGLVDYAGLFPPARLSMEDATRGYAEYHRAPERWMLGRFVVAAARVDEFAAAAEPLLPLGGDAWRLAVLLDGREAHAVASIAAFNAAHRGALCDTVEAKAATTDDIARLAATMRGSDLTMFVEVPVATDPTPLVDAIGARGLRAKIRLGGVTADAFPAPDRVARFLAACIRAKVPFKATAGLHHPLRGEYPLTYDADAPRGAMYGFLNVVLAAALLRDGESEQLASALLSEHDRSAIAFGDDGVRWRGHLFLTARLGQLRGTSLISVGSCSFAEPVAELRAWGWL